MAMEPESGEARTGPPPPERADDAGAGARTGASTASGAEAAGAGTRTGKRTASKTEAGAEVGEETGAEAGAGTRTGARTASRAEVGTGAGAANERYAYRDHTDAEWRGGHKRDEVERLSLEYAEEMERRKADSGLHWEEGAMNQPMRLEGIQRGIPAIKIMRIETMDRFSKFVFGSNTKRDFGSPTCLASHFKYFGIGLSSGTVLVVTSVYNPIKPVEEIDEKAMFLSSSFSTSCSVTTLDFNNQGDLLLSGYSNGQVSLWDLTRGSIVRAISGEHNSAIAFVKFIHQDSSQSKTPKALTCDVRGKVLLHTFTPLPLLRRYTVSTQCLLDGQRGGAVLSISSFPFDETSYSERKSYSNPTLSSNSSGSMNASQSNIQLSSSSVTAGMGDVVMGMITGSESTKKQNIDTSSFNEKGLVVLITSQMALVVNLLPSLQVIAKLERPKGIRENALPYSSWSSYVSSSTSVSYSNKSSEPLNNEGTRDKKIEIFTYSSSQSRRENSRPQISKPGDPEPEQLENIKSDPKIECFLAIGWDNTVQIYKISKLGFHVFKQWELEVSIIGIHWLSAKIIAVITNNCKIILYSFDGVLIEQDFLKEGIDNQSNNENFIVFHPFFVNSFGSPFLSFHNSLTTRGNSLYFLTKDEIIFSRLLHWKYLLQALQDAGDWISAFFLAMEIYDGDSITVVGLPHLRKDIHQVTSSAFISLLFAYIDEAFAYVKMALDSNKSQTVSSSDPQKSSISNPHKESEIANNYDSDKNNDENDAFNNKENFDEINVNIGDKNRKIYEVNDSNKKLMTNNASDVHGKKEANEMNERNEFSGVNGTDNIIQEVNKSREATTEAKGGNDELTRLSMNLNLSVHDAEKRLSNVYEHYSRVGQISIEFCLRLNRLDVLFGPILKRFDDVGQKGIFLELLEPYILKNKLKNINTEIMQYFIEHYKKNNWIERIERCILHMDVSSIDFHQVIKLCKKYNLHTAYIYLFNTALNDFVSPLEELLVCFTEKENPKSEYCGYKSLVYLKFCFLGYAFPPGFGNLPESRLFSLRKEIFDYFLQIDSGKSNSVQSISLLKDSFFYLEKLIDLDSSSTLKIFSYAFPHDGILRIGNDYNAYAFKDGDGGLNMSKTTSDANNDNSDLSKKIHKTNASDEEKDNDKISMHWLKILFGRGKMMELNDRYVLNDKTIQEGIHLLQSLVNVLIRILQIEDRKDESRPFFDEKLNAKVENILKFFAKYLSTGHIVLPKEILEKTLKLFGQTEKRTESNDESFQILEKKESEELVLNILFHVPTKFYDSNFVLSLFQNANFYQVCAFLYAQKGKKYISTVLELLIKDKNNPQNVFTFINELFSRDNFSFWNNHSELESFREMILFRIPDLTNLDCQMTMNLISNHWNNEHEKILKKIKKYPKLQLSYFNAIFYNQKNNQNYLMPSMKEQGIGPENFNFMNEEENELKNSIRVQERSKINLSNEMIELYFELLCQYEPDSVLPFLENNEFFLPEKFLSLCLKFKVKPAACFIYEKMGDLISSVQILFDEFDEILNAMNNALFEFTCIKFEKELIEKNVSESKDEKSIELNEIYKSILSNAMQLPEVVKVEKIRMDAVSLCERNTNKLKAEESEIIWFDVLDRFIFPLQGLKQATTSSASTSDFSSSLTSTHLSSNSKIVYQITQRTKDNVMLDVDSRTLSVIKRVFIYFIECIIQSCMHFIPLQKLIDYFIKKYNFFEFGEFRAAFLEILSNVKYEYSILSSAKKIFEKGLTLSSSKLLREKKRAYFLNSNVCCICNKLISKFPKTKVSDASDEKNALVEKYFGIDKHSQTEKKKFLILFHCNHFAHSICYTNELKFQNLSSMICTVCKTKSFSLYIVDENSEEDGSFYENTLVNENEWMMKSSFRGKGKVKMFHSDIQIIPNDVEYDFSKELTKDTDMSTFSRFELLKILETEKTLNEESLSYHKTLWRKKKEKATSEQNASSTSTSSSDNISEFKPSISLMSKIQSKATTSAATTVSSYLAPLFKGIQRKPTRSFS